MAEKSKSTKLDSRPSLQFNDSSETDSSKQEKMIYVTVEKIQNIDPCKVKEIEVKGEFLGEILIESEPTAVRNDPTELGFGGVIECGNINLQFMDDVLANPIIFTVIDSSAPEVVPPSPLPPLKVDKDNKKKASKTSTSPATTSKPLVIQQNILGICNLDIGFLITGEKKKTETMALELDKKLPPQNSVPWSKLPKLVVSVFSGEQPLVPESVSKSNNVMGVTVESVYNAPGYMSEGNLVDASIPVPSLGDKTNNVVFPNGVVTSIKEGFSRKRWLSLLQTEGNGGRSAKLISPGGCDIYSSLPCHIKVEKEMHRFRKQIQWNMWRNCLLLKTDVNYVFSKLLKYRVWPIEIYMVNKSNPPRTAKSEKKSKAAPSATVSNPEHFTAFLNISPLLYPGVTKTRVAAQLFTYSRTDLFEKFGIERNALLPQSSVVAVKSKAGSERSKISVKDVEENKDAPGVPVFSEDGSPVFIVVEIELQKPLVPKRDPEYLHEQLKNSLSLKGKTSKKMLNLSLAQENFSSSLKDIVSVIVEEFQNFNIIKGNTQFEDFDAEFHGYLCRQDAFNKISNSLENRVIELISEFYGNLTNFTKKIPDIYMYLTEEMHKVTNCIFLGEKKVSSSHFDTNYLQLYAEEAFEQDEYDKAKEYLLEKLTRDPSNPDFWLDYAIFCNNLNDCETAVEAIKEALTLNSSHVIGLLLYGLLMAKLGDASIAELAFQVLLSKYPDFAEGWMGLRMLYVTVNNYEGESVTTQTVIKLEHERKKENNLKENEKERRQDNFVCDKFPFETNYLMAGGKKYGVSAYVNGKCFAEPLSWSPLLCPPGNISIRTAVLMLSLGCHEYACLATSKAMIADANENSSYYLYYEAVYHYLQRRYGEAISLLETFAKQYGKDAFAWELMGHCFYKLQDDENAISCYEFVMESYNRRDDIHLVYLRMGQYYLKTKKYPCAKQVFLTACKYSPTPRVWKGAGIACFRLGELDDAELAFSEANYLDNKDPEIWAYLALTNALAGRLELLQQCYAEAIKRNLCDEELIEEIETYLMQNRLSEEGYLKKK